MFSCELFCVLLNVDLIIITRNLQHRYIGEPIEQLRSKSSEKLCEHLPLRNYVFSA